MFRLVGESRLSKRHKTRRIISKKNPDFLSWWLPRKWIRRLPSTIKLRVLSGERRLKWTTYPCLFYEPENPVVSAVSARRRRSRSVPLLVTPAKKQHTKSYSWEYLKIPSLVSPSFTVIYRQSKEISNILILEILLRYLNPDFSKISYLSRESTANDAL